ncbi:MAG: hypothetical protein ABEJ72_00350 [Candidatus Aenigmatarchaeota archaeon]
MGLKDVLSNIRSKDSDFQEELEELQAVEEEEIIGELDRALERLLKATGKRIENVSWRL